MIALDFGGKKALFYGDSRTRGDHASSTTKRWTSLICAERNGIEDNRGVSGMVLQNSNQTGSHTIFDFNSIISKTTAYKYLFIAFGINDVGLNNGTFTASLFKQKLIDTVDHAVNAKGWSYSDIVLVTPNYINAYNIYYNDAGTTNLADIFRLKEYVKAVKQVAVSKLCITADIFTYFSSLSNKDSLLDDGLHENDAGYRVVANFFENMDFTPNTAPVVGPPIKVSGRKILIKH